MNRKYGIFVMVFLLSIGFVTATPHLIPLQGVATDTSGNPVSGDLAVRIYMDEIGGTPVWDSGTNYNGAIQDGIFDVLLGSITALDLDNTQLYWIEIDINGETISSRQEFYPGSGEHTHTHVAEDITGGTLVVDGLNVDSGTLYVDNVNDRVGIGTSSPGAKLEVVNDVTNAVLKVSGSGNPYIEIDDTGVDDTDWIIQGGLDGDLRFYDETNAKEVMRLQDSTGNVGIGTTGPNVKLYVKTDGDIVSIFEDDDNPSIILKDANAGTDLKYAGLRLNNNLLGIGKMPDSLASFTDIVSINTNTGNVGIGTSSPKAKLEVNMGTGDGLLLSTTDNGYIWNALNITNTNGWGNANLITVSSNAGTQFVVKGNGNVGIGTGSPTAKLDVAGDAKISGNLDVSGSLTRAGNTVWDAGNSDWDGGSNACGVAADSYVTCSASCSAYGAAHATGGSCMWRDKLDVILTESYCSGWLEGHCVAWTCAGYNKQTDDNILAVNVHCLKLVGAF